jgi:hypothetical protein
MRLTIDTEEEPSLTEGGVAEGMAEEDEEEARAVDLQTDRTSPHLTIRPFGRHCLLQRRVHPNSIHYHCTHVSLKYSTKI